MPRWSATQLAAHQVDGRHGERAEVAVHPGGIPGLQRLPALGVHRPSEASKRQVRFEVRVDFEAELSQGVARTPTERPQPIEVVIPKSDPEDAGPSRPAEGADSADGELESLMSTHRSVKRAHDRRDPVGIDAAQKVQRQMDLLDRAGPHPLLEGRQPLEWSSQRLPKLRR